MGALIRLAFPLISYFCVATVITLSAGYGYLRNTGALDNESMFQIVSMLHGVDLDEIATANQTDLQDVPPEEMSFEDRQQHMLMNTLNLQAKKDDIEKNITVFKAEAAKLDNLSKHFETFKDEVQQFLDDHKKEALASGLEGVRKQWETLNAKKQTKELLLKMFNAGQIDIVIKLLNGMPPKKRTEILKTLDTPEDLDMLYVIEQEMLQGGPKAKFIGKKLDELEQEKN